MTEQERIKAIHQRTREAVNRMLVEYGATKDHLETRHWEKLDRILDAGSPMEAIHLSEVAITSVHTTVLFLFSKSKIIGRDPTASYEKKARKAESLARMFTKKAESKFSDAKEVIRFRKNAEKNKTKALEFWKLAGMEPPSDLVLSDEELAEAEAEVSKRVKPKKARRVRAT
jgi:hypothetical protein